MPNLLLENFDQSEASIQSHRSIISKKILKQRTSSQMSTNFFLADPIIISIMINFQDKSIETKEFCCEIFHFCEAYF